jgi:hypothetical protein
MIRRICFSLFRVVAALAVIAVLTWWLMIRMPGKNIARAAILSADEVSLRTELQGHVQKLAGDIGERNMNRYPALLAAAEYIEQSFSTLALPRRRDTYELRGRSCHNLEVEVPGESREILVIGAHYDSVDTSPGANDNATGVAATLVLARRFAEQKPKKTIRFVAFVNEEPPYFQTEVMGILVYARHCK